MTRLVMWWRKRRIDRRIERILRDAGLPLKMKSVFTGDVTITEWRPSEWRH